MTTEFTFLNETTLPDPYLTAGTNPNTVTFHMGPSEILKITEDGFYVRGKKVEADENEAASVYSAFKQFLVWHGLTKIY